MESIKAAILEVLTNMPEAEASELAHHLCDEVGVDGPDDLALVESSDLTMLKPIQVRKLIQKWKKNDGLCILPSPQLSSASSSRGSSPIISLPGTQSSTADEPEASFSQLLPSQSSNWSRGYKIPWHKFSKPLMNSLSSGKRPKPSQRREMIRTLVDDIQKIVDKPSKTQLAHIAEQITLKYPQSFKDVINNEVIGTGYDSLLKNISQRVYNQNRKETSSVESSTEEERDEPAQKKRKSADEYGCINFMPAELPPGHTDETLLERKQELKVCFQSGQQMNKEDMKVTYVLQRRDIASGDFTIPQLQIEWPYLFQEEGLAIHFEELVGINARACLERAYQEKGKTIISFMEMCGKQVLRAPLLAIERGRTELGNDSPQIPGLVVLLMKYFGEKTDSLMIQMESTTTKGDVDRKKDLPTTPVLIACGEMLTTQKWMLAIDKNVVADNIPAFIVALGMLFSSYYCFGIEYSADAAATLDFIQRCFMKINPEKGSKVKGKGTGTHPKVLSLIKDIGDYEWSL